jgi:hypothetical protein
MAGHAIHLLLSLEAGPGTDDEELAELTRQLRTEFMEVDVESIDFASIDEAPVGSKSGPPVDWGTLLLTLAASGGVLTTIINVIQSWLTRHDRHRLSIEINGDRLELTGISTDEQQQLIDAWLSRHRGFVVSND